jgi:nucleoside-diphosphate-sugar epimerase
MIHVTSVAGFFGIHVAERLRGGGEAVIGLDNLSYYCDGRLKEVRLVRLASNPESRSHVSIWRIVPDYCDCSC